MVTRDYYRKKLNKLLSRLGDEEAIQLLWAAHILQTSNPNPALKFILPSTIPVEAINPKKFDKYSIHKWEIETLVNELMTVPKAKLKKNRPIRKLRGDHFGNVTNLVNLLRELENAEFSILKKRQDIFFEMGRIAARQFDWQRGFINIPQFYRNAFVYGQGPCAEYFKAKHGITINRFSQIGFLLFVSLSRFPVVRKDRYWDKLDVDWDEIEKVLALIARPFSNAAVLARDLRCKTIHTADKASILRQTPCLRFGKEGERVRAPLPELILERVTSGVFYDLVNGDGSIRDDYGRRFEEYSKELLSRNLKSLQWEREFSYRKGSHRFETPDILCKQRGRIKISFECKATRMSHEAMFGINPIKARGYKDITRGIFQLWRFFSHCRLGYVGQLLDEEAVGVVLTLDNWLVMADALRKQVLADARTLTQEKAPEVCEIDMKPIVFVAVPDLEQTLSTATEAAFLKALKLSNTDNYWGWRLSGVNKDLLKGKGHPKRTYPFTDELGKLLPWWDEMGSLIEAQTSPTAESNTD